MYSTNFKDLPARSQRVKYLRLLVNAFVVTFLAMFALVSVGMLLPAISPIIGSLLEYILLPICLFLGLPGILTNILFRGGVIRCPRCKERFAPRFAAFIEPDCTSCGFNCLTMRMPNDV